MVKAVSLAIARDGASGGVVRTVIVRLLEFLRLADSSSYVSCCSVHIMFEIGIIAMCCLVFQINSEGVTRNYYPGDTLPLWHEELEPQNSLLDILNAPAPEPMNI